jgi:ATP-binding cassette, subfamily B, bacterial MsbA
MNLYLRILRYIRPYWAHLAASIVCVIFFVTFSSVSIFSIGPFLTTLFGTQSGTRSAEVQGTRLQNSGTGTTQPSASALPQLSLASTEKLKDKAYGLFLGSDWQKDRWKALRRFCVILMSVILLKSAFDYLQAYLMAHVEQAVIRDIRNDIYIHLNRLSLGYFNRTKTGKLISRITNDVTLVNGGISASFFTMVQNPLLIVAFLTMAFIISWKLTLIAFFVLPVSLLIISWIGLSLRKSSTVSQERMAEVTTVLQESITGARIVKAFGMETFEIKRFSEKTHQYFKTLLRLTRARNLASPLTEFLGTGVGVGILWFGGAQVLRGEALTPDRFILFLGCVFSLMRPVKEISSVNNRIQEALAAGERIFELLDTDPEVKETPHPVRVKAFRRRVEYRNVTFAYDEGSPVLRNVSLAVDKGEVLAIVGPSGAGKSTFVDLLPRFYDPRGGSIEIDGEDIRHIKLTDLRGLMAIVTQETILFNDTVRNNIAYGLADVPHSKITEAAKAANAHRFIESMENGYDTVIGERGMKLSGGERQRLAIARALLKDSPILILDEATSSLDTESELLVQEAIDRLMKNRTSFVIAHRLSTIQHADEIVVLHKGQIAEKGTHASLLRRGGLYKKLYHMQFRDGTGVET